MLHVQIPRKWTPFLPTSNMFLRKDSFLLKIRMLLEFIKKLNMPLICNNRLGFGESTCLSLHAKIFSTFGIITKVAWMYSKCYLSFFKMSGMTILEVFNFCCLKIHVFHISCFPQNWKPICLPHLLLRPIYESILYYFILRIFRYFFSQFSAQSKKCIIFWLLNVQWIGGNLGFFFKILFRWLHTFAIKGVGHSVNSIIYWFIRKKTSSASILH